MTNQNDRRFISALARGLEVLSAFSSEKPKMTLSEITRQTGLPKSTVVRILYTLVDLGYMGFQASDATYSPGPKSMTLGLSVVSSMDLVTLATPYAEKLAQSSGRIVNIGVRDDLSVIYCARMGAHQLLQLNIQVGSRLPLHNTAVGRALIAFSEPGEREAILARLEQDPASRASAGEIRRGLEQTLAQGFVMTDRVLSPSVRAIAAPIWRRGNELAAAMNVACLADSITMEEIAESTSPELIKSAQAVSLLLGASPEFVSKHRSLSTGD